MTYAKILAGFLIVALMAGVIGAQEVARQQETPPPPVADSQALPAVPQGVEVMARGPIHEAFASPTTEPVPTQPVPKKPPQSLDEMPPAEKPEGDVVWIGGYWAFDDERKAFLWVSGTWRKPPPGKHWVSGYWKEEGEQWRWVPGFWAAIDNQEGGNKQLTYMPEPPAPPEVAKPGEPPTPDSFFVPGQWAWHDAGYVVIGGREVYRDAGYAWTAGYWARVQPGYVWVAAHYRWTPSGYIYIPGYWDLAISKRGVLYAPVVVDTAVVGPGFVYTPAYAVSDTILVDAMFVRPCYCHYYFGDYYGVVYKDWGFESCVVYGRWHYDPVFVYATWEHRSEPNWVSVQLDLTLARHAGRAPLPPRTLVQQNTIIQNNITNVTNVTNVTNINRTTVNNAPVLVPSSQLSAATGVRTVPLDSTARLAARQQAQAVQQVALNRSAVEASTPSARINQPRVANLTMPPSSPGSRFMPSPSGVKAPKSVNPSFTPSSAHPSGTAASAGSFSAANPQASSHVPPARPNPAFGPSVKGIPNKGPMPKAPTTPFRRPPPRPSPGGDRGDSKKQ